LLGEGSDIDVHIEECGVWEEGRVVEVQNIGALIKIHVECHPSSTDFILPVDSNRIAMHHTHTTPWRAFDSNSLYTTEVGVKGVTRDPDVWFRGLIVGLDTRSLTIDVDYGFGVVTRVPFYSERICPLGKFFLYEQAPRPKKIDLVPFLIYKARTICDAKEIMIHGGDLDLIRHAPLRDRAAEEETTGIPIPSLADIFVSPAWGKEKVRLKAVVEHVVKGKLLSDVFTDLLEYFD
jgi:hypothetical protein